MSSFHISISPYGPKALIVQWPAEVNEAILNDILSLKEELKTQFDSQWEYIPAYNSMVMVNVFASFDFKIVKEHILMVYQTKGNAFKKERFLWKLPVCYDDDFGLDLKFLEEQLQLTKNDIIHLHTKQEYTVYGIGFLPGFMYLGGLPEVLETKRRDTPRLEIFKGAVGLAGKQTGIYPQDSPGGWNIIGKCPVPLFNAEVENPCFVSVGDKVRFVPISRAEFEIHQIEVSVGILQPEKESLDA